MLTIKTVDILNHEYVREVDGAVVWSPESNIDPNGVGSQGEGFDYTPETVFCGTGYERGERACVYFKSKGILYVKQYGDAYVMNEGGRTVAAYHLRTYRDAADENLGRDQSKEV